MSTENIVTGKYYRILKDKTNKIWDRISFWTHADDVQLSSGATLSSDLSTKQTKIDKTQTDFATVESSPSTRAYTRGQMLIWNNQLYRVKAAIAVGNTLTVGTNIEVATVSTLSSMLIANNGNGFYFDYKDGKPGFYPTASKTASQFVPFGGTAPTKVYSYFAASIQLSLLVDLEAKSSTSCGRTVTLKSGVTFTQKSDDATAAAGTVTNNSGSTFTFLWTYYYTTLVQPTTVTLSNGQSANVGQWAGNNAGILQILF